MVWSPARGGSTTSQLTKGTVRSRQKPNQGTLTFDGKQKCLKPPTKRHTGTPAEPKRVQHSETNLWWEADRAKGNLKRATHQRSFRKETSLWGLWIGQTHPNCLPEECVAKGKPNGHIACFRASTTTPKSTGMNPSHRVFWNKGILGEDSHGLADFCIYWDESEVRSHRC